MLLPPLLGQRRVHVILLTVFAAVVFGADQFLLRAQFDDCSNLYFVNDQEICLQPGQCLTIYTNQCGVGFRCDAAPGATVGTCVVDSTPPASTPPQAGPPTSGDCADIYASGTWTSTKTGFATVMINGAKNGYVTPQTITVTVSANDGTLPATNLPNGGSFNAVAGKAYSYTATGKNAVNTCPPAPSTGACSFAGVTMDAFAPTKTGIPANDN